METKKIIIFMPSVEKGGADKNFYILSNFLAKKFENLIVVTSSNLEKKKLNKNIKILKPKLFFWYKFGRNIKTFISMIILIKLFFENKKILVFSLQSNLFTILLCKIFSNDIITRSNSFPNNWTNNFIKKYLFKKFYSLATHCIVNSLQTKNDFIKYYKIVPTCIYNPLDISKINKLSKKSVTKIFNNNKLKIINVGRLSEEKDHITFLKALCLIKNEIDFEAVIMGQGVLKNKIINFIRENKLKKHVKLISYKSNPYPYIKQSDFVILTSLHEGLPNILLESIILKKFIISSDCVSGPKEILSNGKGGALFKVKNFQKLKELIIYYKKNPLERKKKIRYAFNNVGRFGYNKNLNLYYKTIETYLNKKN